MADLDDEGAFELEEELGLPQSGPVLEDGMDIYGHEGEEQHEDTTMQEPETAELYLPQPSQPFESGASQAPVDPPPQAQAAVSVGGDAAAERPLPEPSPPVQPAAAAQKPASTATMEPQPEPLPAAAGAADAAAAAAAVGGPGSTVGPDGGEQGQQLSRQERDAMNMQDAQESHQKVYLANLTWWTTDADIETLCAECGKLTNMDFVVDRSNGKSKGCVLVEFATPEAAIQCKEQLHGQVLHGRPIVTTFQKSGPGVKMGPPYSVNTAEGLQANQGRSRGMYTGGRGRGEASFGGEGDGSGRDRFGGGGWRGRGAGGRYGAGGRFGGMDGMMGRGAPGMPPMMMPPMMMPPGLLGMMPGMMPGLPGMMPGMPPL